jgi:hypothetical protein
LIDNEKINGAKCPCHVNTRWIYDFDICRFIKNHYEKCSQVVVIHDEVEPFYQIAAMFKSLTTIFEDPKTPLGSAYPILEKSIFALDELSDRISIAQFFSASMRHYTLQSVDASLWLFAYCLTRKGQAEFLDQLQNSNKARKMKGFISDFIVRSQKEVDTGAIDDILDETVNELLEEGSSETVPDPEAHQELHEDERREGDEPDENVESHILLEDELIDTKEFKPMKSIINLASNLLLRIRCPSEEIEASIDFLKKYLTSEFRHSGLSPLDDRRFNWLALRPEEFLANGDQISRFISNQVLGQKQIARE